MIIVALLIFGFSDSDSTNSSSGHLSIVTPTDADNNIELQKLLIAFIENWAWPILIFILYLFLKKDISSLIKRISKLTPTSIELSDAMQSIELNVAPSITAADELLEKLDSKLLTDEAEAIKQTLNEKSLDTDSDASKVLIKYLAATQLSLYFEYIDRSIFNSQIELLEYLNSLAKSDKEDLKKFYEGASKKWPIPYKDYPYDSYIDWLVKNVLITPINGDFQITNFGVEYILFLYRSGRRQSDLRIY